MGLLVWLVGLQQIDRAKAKTKMPSRFEAHVRARCVAERAFPISHILDDDSVKLLARSHVAAVETLLINQVRAKATSQGCEEKWMAGPAPE